MLILHDEIRLNRVQYLQICFSRDFWDELNFKQCKEGDWRVEEPELSLADLEFLLVSMFDYTVDLYETITKHVIHLVYNYVFFSTSNMAPQSNWYMACFST